MKKDNQKQWKPGPLTQQEEESLRQEIKKTCAYVDKMMAKERYWKPGPLTEQEIKLLRKDKKRISDYCDKTMTKEIEK